MPQLVVHEVPEHLITGQKIPKNTCSRKVKIALYSDKSDLELLEIFSEKIDYKIHMNEIPYQLFHYLYDHPVGNPQQELKEVCEACVDFEIQQQIREFTNGTKRK